MALSDELLEQIGAYLSGQLTAAEKARFETRMQQDANLRNEVAIQREIKQGLAFMAQKEQFRAMHTDLNRRGLLTSRDESSVPSAGQPLPTHVEPTYVTPPPTAKLKRTVFREQWAYFAMAAVLVIVLGFGWVIYQNQQTERVQLTQNARTFDTFFSPDLKLAPVLAPDPDRAAAPQTESASSDSVRLREAVQALQRPDTQAAIDKLSVLIQSAPGHWSASAQWYLALAYLKTNQRQKARALAEQIAGLNGHPYQREATQLLRQLSTNPSEP
ncbi:hypothetical protein [Spirosoma arcticum]